MPCPPPPHRATVRASTARRGTTPRPRTTGLLAVAVVLLALPIIALLWVSSYARKDPALWGFPFFIWYQFLWVFLCSGLTYAAYRLVLMARPHRPMTERTARLR